jgi:acetate kinase
VTVKVLVVNAGSSSIKYQVFDMTDESVIAKGLVDRVGTDGSILSHSSVGKEKYHVNQYLPDHHAGMELILKTLIDEDYGCLNSLDEIGAVGHRIVHGGRFAASVLIDQSVMDELIDCYDLAPLHNPPHVAGIRACQKLMPDIPQAVVFDTAFHQTMEPKAYMYAVPYWAYEKYRIRKYGFHGTSHKYVSSRAAEMLNQPIESLKIISLHLGNGASVAAIKYGKVIDTSMGFTPLGGLVMGTRSGDVDPAVVIYLTDKLKMNGEEANDFFNKKSGILGLSGISHDFRDLVAAHNEGNQRASMALEVYTHRVKAYIGNYMAQLNGCDCMVFTAGVGENCWEVREKICSNLDFFGITINPEKNKVRGKEVDISAADSRVKVLIIPTNEELVIARDTFQLATEALRKKASAVSGGN